MNEETQLSKKYKEIMSYLSERQKRIFLSIEAKYLGYGGITKVSKLSGVSRVSITKGKKYQLNPKTHPSQPPQKYPKFINKSPHFNPTIWAF